MDERKIFISFSTKETAEAQRICTLLEENGFPCFICLRDLIAGEEYAAQLLENLDQSAAMVLLLSNAANASPHVLSEVEYAVRKEIPLLVYALEEVELSKSMEYFLMTHQWILQVEDRDERLINGLKYFLEHPEDASERNHPAIGGRPATEFPKAINEAKASSASALKNRKLLIQAASAAILLLGVILVFGMLGKKNSSAEQRQEDDSQTKEDIQIQNSQDAYVLGDTLTFGTYNEEPINWRVIQIREDHSLLLISQNILSFKIFDAAEGGKYNDNGDNIDYWSHDYHEVEDSELLRKIRGNNDWSVSNLRTWLNSDKEVVKYADHAPDLQAVGDTYYNIEPGFLHGFTKDERSSLIPVTNLTTANCFSENVSDNKVQTEDLVFLLSSDELSLLDEAGISPYAAPSLGCLQQDQGKSYYNSFIDAYKVKNYYWWLRDNDGTKVNLAYAVPTEVNQDKQFISDSVGVCAYGVRPVICVNADNPLLQR